MTSHGAPLSDDKTNPFKDKACDSGDTLETHVPRRPTFEPISRPQMRRTNSITTTAMISRSASIQTVSRNTKDFFNCFRRAKRKTPLDQTLEKVSKDDGAPVERDAPVGCIKVDIFKSMLPRQGEESHFPEFDNLGNYILEPGVQKELWDMEAQRLWEAVEKPVPLRFSSTAIFDRCDEKGYRHLSSLCQQILTAITLCLLDNECINVEHCGRLSNKGKLSKLIDQAKMGGEASKSKSNTCIPGLPTENSEKFLAQLYCLINYISAVLARLITQTSPSPYWQSNLLGVLAKRVTKIKILLRSLHVNTQICVKAGESALEKSLSSDRVSSTALDDEEECEELLRMIEADEKEGLASAEQKEVASYCVDENKFRSGINSAMRYILTSMRFANRSGLPATTFEICSVAYETGFEGFKALLFQDRDLEYSATSDRDTLNTAHSAFNILNHTIKFLQDHGPGCDTHLQTYIEYAYLTSDSRDKSLVGVDLSSHRIKKVHLQSMDDIIAIMVPLIMTSPILVSNFTSFRTMMALAGSIRDDVQPYKEGEFHAFFRMYTNEFEEDIEQQKVLKFSDALGSGLFSRCCLLSGSTVKSSSESTDEDKKKRTKIGQLPKYFIRSPDEDKDMREKMQELTKYTEEMKHWVIDENTVTVNHSAYVWSAIVIAILFAAGGLAIGFSVGDRIHGVDPSNLSTYLWVFAVFVLLAARSIQVNSWTWNDFLHRRVRCTSVSELHAVSGINEQLIIAKLLHDEAGGSGSNIRGPYNSVFLNRSSTGFSIDCPINAATLLVSGLIPLKVITPRGHALVFLDSRRGTTLRMVEHQGDQTKDKLVCEDLNRQQDYAIIQVKKKRQDSQQHFRLQLTRSKNLKWKRVQGIYNVSYAEFA